MGHTQLCEWDPKKYILFLTNDSNSFPPGSSTLNFDAAKLTFAIHYLTSRAGLWGEQIPASQGISTDPNLVSWTVSVCPPPCLADCMYILYMRERKPTYITHLPQPCQNCWTQIATSLRHIGCTWMHTESRPKCTAASQWRCWNLWWKQVVAAGGTASLSLLLRWILNRWILFLNSKDIICRY